MDSVEVELDWEFNGGVYVNPNLQDVTNRVTFESKLIFEEGFYMWENPGDNERELVKRMMRVCWDRHRTLFEDNSPRVEQV